MTTQHNFILDGDAAHARAGGRALKRLAASRGGIWHSPEWESMEGPVVVKDHNQLVWTYLARLQGPL